jgi:hypothetical protein
LKRRSLFSTEYRQCYLPHKNSNTLLASWGPRELQQRKRLELALPRSLYPHLRGLHDNNTSNVEAPSPSGSVTLAGGCKVQDGIIPRAREGEEIRVVTRIETALQWMGQTTTIM